MADKTLFGRLRRLFSTNVIVRNVGGRQLKIADTEKLQGYYKKSLTDRFTRLYQNSKGSGYGLMDSTYKQAERLGLFRDYETMDSDPIIASALDVYSDETTMKNEYGEVLEIQSDNDNVKKILHNLFYDILNIEFNLWPWVRNMCKYGDFFLHLDVQDKYGVTNVTPLTPYIVARAEGGNPENPYEVKFVITQDNTGQAAYHTRKETESAELENFQMAHFRLLSDSNYVPYGKSMIESARKIWKQLSLMEDAMMIHRIMRAPEKRVFKVDIGNIPPAEVDNYMQQIINKMKKTPLVDESTGDYNLKYNIQNITEDFFMPVRGGDSGTNIETLGSLSYDAVDDIEYLRNKMLAALKVPKAFLGYEEQVGSKATLAAEDVRFARTIERIQRIVVSELTKIAIVHLYAQGFTDEELVNFELSLTNPSTIYEQEKIELWNNKTSLASSMIQDGLMSSDWIYKNIYNFTKDEIEDQEEKIVYDYKQKFRYSQIENEGNDPKESGESVGTPSDMQSPDDEGGDDDVSGSVFDDEGGAPEGGQEGAGRPKEPNKYGKDSGVRGRDVLGAHDKKKGGSGSRKYGNTLALAHFDKMKKLMNKSDVKIITESDEVNKEYHDDVSTIKGKE
jgi:hypothetical protein